MPETFSILYCFFNIFVCFIYYLFNMRPLHLFHIQVFLIPSPLTVYGVLVEYTRLNYGNISST